MADQKQPGANSPKYNKANAAAKAEDAKKAKTPEENRAERSARFMELAPKRTRSILKSLEILGNCSNKSGYEYSEAQINKIFAAIDAKVLETKAQFKPRAAKEDVSFSL